MADTEEVKEDKNRFSLSIADSEGKITISNQPITQEQLDLILRATYAPGNRANVSFSSGITPAQEDISPREFLDSKGASTNPQKFTAILAFLKETTSQNSASIEEIKAELERAGEPITANFTRDFKRAISYGWIARSQQESNKFYITGKGTKVLETNFTENIRKISVGRGKKSGKGRFSPTVVRKEVLSLELAPKTEDLPGYFALETKKDRILWFLAQAKNNGIEMLNHKEVSLLADKIGDSIPQKSITSLTEEHKKKGYIVTPLDSDGTRYLKILEDGLAYLRAK